MLSFPHCIVLASLKNFWCSSVCGVMSRSLNWFHVSAFMPIPSCFYYYCSKLKFKVRNGVASRYSYIVQDSFCYLGFFSIQSWVSFFEVCEELWWDIDGIVLNLLVAFGKTVIFTMLILLIQEHGRSFHFSDIFITFFLQRLKELVV